MSSDDRQIYISYAWGGESEWIVNELDADLQTRGITDVSIAVMVAYSAAENDIFYPRELPDDYDSKFDETIKKYLVL